MTGILGRRAGWERRVCSRYIYTRQISLGKSIIHGVIVMHRACLPLAIKLHNHALPLAEIRLAPKRAPPAADLQNHSKFQFFISQTKSDAMIYTVDRRDKKESSYSCKASAGSSFSQIGSLFPGLLFRTVSAKPISLAPRGIKNLRERTPTTASTSLLHRLLSRHLRRSQLPL